MRVQAITVTIILMCLVVIATSSCSKSDQQTPVLNFPEEEYTETMNDMLEEIAYGLRIYDVEHVYGLCTEFLDGYYYAITGERKTDFNLYFMHENLIFYMNQLVKENGRSTSSKIDQMEHGLDTIDWETDRQHVYLSIGTNVTMEYGGGFSEMHEFLVQNQNGTLVIVDCYAPSNGGSGLLDVYRKQEGRINDPTIWENEQWVSDFFQKAHIDEES